MGGNGELDYQWEPVGYEELAWRVDHDALEGVPKSRRRKITGTYRAAVPFELRDKDVLIPAELQSRMGGSCLPARSLRGAAGSPRLRFASFAVAQRVVGKFADREHDVERAQRCPS